MSNKWTWNGIGYSSLAAAAAAVGVSKPTMRWRFKKGYTCDADMIGRGNNTAPTTRKVVWNDEEYVSIADAAKATGIRYITLAKRTQQGYTRDEDVPRRGTHTNREAISKEVVWNGIKYKSRADAAKALGITRQALHMRIKKGYTCDEDMKRHSPIIGMD